MFKFPPLRSTNYSEILILILSFLLYGCKKEETAQNQEVTAAQEKEEEITQEVIETQQVPEYHPECEISFDYENFFEISQKGLDLDYPHFSFTYAMSGR